MTAHSAPAMRPLSRLRVWCSLLPLLGLCGCTSLSKSSLSEMQLAIRGTGDALPTTAKVASIPYYQMQAVGADGSAVLVLGNQDGARQAWYGENETVIFLKHGRIVQTLGLKQNLDGLQLPENDPFAHGLENLKEKIDYRRVEDWSPGYRYGVVVNAELFPAVLENISILGVEHRVIRVDEQVSAPAAGYRATNHYWVDPRDGFVWQSEQHVAPGLTLKLVQLKPYRESSL